MLPLQLGWLATQRRAYRRFQRAVADPAAAQQHVLDGLITALGPSAYGRDVGLDRVRRVDDLQDLPITDYAAMEPWIDRAAAGEPDVLTTEPLEIFEPTGGSTGGTKLIPMTARLRAEFAEAVGVWMVDLHRGVPRLLGTRSYWSVSRAVRERRTTSGGIPIGFDDDAAYFGRLEQWAIRRLMAVDSKVSQSPDLETWRRQTATGLVECADLGLISVWSPTFLTLLMSWLDVHWPTLKVSRRSRARLERAWTGTQLNGATLWPRLRVVSAWADGFAATHVPALQRHFPAVAFQPKGLLATEGVVSFPLWGSTGGVLAVTSHVVELRDLQTDRAVQPHQARLGAAYQPLLTTGGGLVRYGLPDAVEVVGYTRGVPRIRLTGRLDRGSDRVGEKLTEAFVDAVIRGLPGVRSFAMLVPTTAPLAYTLVVDGEAPDPEALDARLREAYHYAYARDLGQLDPPSVVVRPDAWKRWERAVEDLGLVLGEQKPGALEIRPAVIDALLA